MTHPGRRPVPARKENRIRTLTIILATLTLAVSAQASTGHHALGHWSPGVGNVRNAVYFHFCGKKYVRCSLGDQAMRVVDCETGGTYSVWATNGQYLGLFQMGDFARGRYGHASNPWGQARAAYRYFAESGRDWSPWACKPW